MSKIDHIEHVNKNIDHIDHVEKFNPYHDSKGRFASASGYASFTFRTKDPKKQHMADMAMAREKERQGAAASKPQKQYPIQTEHKDWNYMYIGEDEAIRRIAADTKADMPRAMMMFEAVRGYTGEEYEAIRVYSLDNDTTKSPRAGEYIAKASAIEDFIQHSEKWGGSEIMRGIHVEEDVAKDILKKATSGEPLDMCGASSWSSKKSVAEDFANEGFEDEVKIMFHLSGRVNGTSIQHLSNFDNEAEVLLSKNARFEPKSVTQEGSTWHIYGAETSLD